jgi:proteasome lid subunit RPN8/RPN11
MLDHDAKVTVHPPVSNAPAREVDAYLLRNLLMELAEFNDRATSIGDDPAVSDAYARVIELRELRRATQRLSEVEPETVNTYLMRTSFLEEAFRILTRTPHEHLVYATGAEDGDRVFSVSQLVHFDLESQSMVGAAPEPASQAKALLSLEETRERLLATLHSHPGTGPGATDPSSVDLSTQRNLEKAGCPAIGLVFSRDGYVRFYAVERRFRVSISGAGCERVERDLFRLTNVAPRTLLRRVINHD